MIVDDEFAAQDMLRQYVKAKLPDYQVVHVCNHGKDALEAFQRKPVDVILVDVRMPVMDGLTFLEKLNEFSRDYAAIIISSYNEFEYAKTAIGLGVCHYLLKPVDFKELEKAIYAATQTLREKRIAAAMSSSIREEKQEMFFSNVFSGKYADAAAAEGGFAEAGFSFPYDSAGVYVQLNLENTTEWNYGQDELAVAIGNILNLLYRPISCISMNRTQSAMDFVVIGQMTTENISQLCRQAKSLLKIQLSVKKTIPFQSVEELRETFERKQRKVAAGVVTDSDEMPETILRKRIYTAVEYMKQHFEEDLSRDELAQTVFISPAHFSRCFKEIMGVSYKDYLTEIRMQQAIILLGTPMKISEIANRCGYQNNNRFNINFRQYTGYTPTEYRTNVLKTFFGGGGKNEKT